MSCLDQPTYKFTDLQYVLISNVHIVKIDQEIKCTMLHYCTAQDLKLYFSFKVLGSAVIYHSALNRLIYYH